MKILLILALLLAGCSTEQPKPMCDDIGGGVVVCPWDKNKEPREPHRFRGGQSE